MNNSSESIQYLLNPSTIAIVGASNNVSKPGGRIIAYLKEKNFEGEIYPINPKEEEIQGLKSYSSLTDIPGTVDLACLLIPSKILPGIMEDCATKKVKTVLINTAGFAEMGAEGEKVQKEIVQLARDNGIRICGPNTIGVVNANKKLFASFSMALETKNIPTDGKISFVTQSGAIGGGIISKAWENSVGINNWVSSGNEADLNTADYINYFVEDEQSDVICVFLEGINDGEKLKNSLQAARDAKKPVVMYKNGRTAVGQKSVKSHTGSLAGNHEVYKTVLKQFGVIEANELDDLFDKAIALADTNSIKGKNIGVVSTSGGACTIVADKCIELGMEVPDLTPEGKQKLKEVLPDFGTPQNPFDTTAMITSNPDYFTNGLQVFIDDENIDAMVIMLTTLAGSIAERVADDIIKLRQKTNKPMFVAWTIAESLAKEGMDKLRKAGIPLYPNAERAVRSLQAIVEFSEYHAEKEKLMNV